MFVGGLLLCVVCLFGCCCCVVGLFVVCRVQLFVVCDSLFVLCVAFFGVVVRRFCLRCCSCVLCVRRVLFRTFFVFVFPLSCCLLCGPALGMTFIVWCFCLLLVVCWLLLCACCLLRVVVRCSLFVVCRMFDVCSCLLLFVVGFLLHTSVYSVCLLFVWCDLLFVIWCLPCNESCSVFRGCHLMSCVFMYVDGCVWFVVGCWLLLFVCV